MISYDNKIPTVEEYNRLTNQVGWGTREKNIVEEALNHTLFAVCAYDDHHLIGSGRIIGDKTIFLYIQDVMVEPQYQHQKIGTEIMYRLLKQIEEYKKINPYIRVYLGASKGRESFYQKFGFITREEADLGKGMILISQ